jgi:hypothetical protein
MPLLALSGELAGVPIPPPPAPKSIEEPRNSLSVFDVTVPDPTKPPAAAVEAIEAEAAALLMLAELLEWPTLLFGVVTLEALFAFCMLTLITIIPGI